MPGGFFGGGGGGGTTDHSQLTNRGLADAHPISSVTGLQGGLDAKAPLANPTLSGNVGVPTRTAGDSSANAASTAFIQAALAALLNSAPSTLDTLNEIAVALGNDPNFATTILNALAGKQPLALVTNSQTGTAYTLAASDAGKRVSCSNAAANTLTLPSQTTAPLAIGFWCFINVTGAGATTITPDSGVTITKRASLSLTSSEQGEWFIAVLTATNTWRAEKFGGGGVSGNVMLHAAARNTLTANGQRAVLTAKPFAGALEAREGGTTTLADNDYATFADLPAMPDAAQAGGVGRVLALNGAVYGCDGTEWTLLESMREVFTPIGPLHAWDDTASAQTLASFTLPGNALGSRDSIELYGLWAHHNSATNKTAAITVGGTNRAIYANATTTNAGHTMAQLRNQGARDRQVAQNGSSVFALTMSSSPQRASHNFATAIPLAYVATHPAINTVNVSTFASLVRASNVVTMTVAANPLVSAGSYIRIAGNTDAGAGTSFNGTFLVTAISGSGPYTVSWAQTGSDRTASALDGTFNRAITLESGYIRHVRGA